MGLCFSGLPGGPQKAANEAGQKQACDVLRLPSHILVFILQQLHQEQLFGTIPLVCKVWRHAAQQAAQSIQLNLAPLVLSPMRQLHLPQMLLWLQRNSQQLQQLNLSTSTPLGWTSRRALLRCLAAKHSSMMLQLRQLTLQLDLDNQDLEFLAQHICTHAPRLKSLKLQPVKPSLADLQLMVLACILGNLVGIDALGPVLPHLDACAGSVQRLASTATQLHSLALSRYELGSTACISNATQLTALTLQHCGLNNTSLGGLASLQQLRRLELSDNFLTAASLGALVQLSNLTHLDLSVMPSISRMRASSEAGDIWALGKLHSLKELNIIGFGVSDASPLSSLSRLSRWDAGLNPLSTASLRVIGQLPQLQHLELGGISQAWVLSSALPPQEALRARDACWYGLVGVQQVSHLDLGGSNFSHAVWVSHMCPVLAGITNLKRLHLAHCHIPAGRLVHLLPALRDSLQDLNIDRCSCNGDELAAMLSLTSLTKLSAAAVAPKLGNKQCAVLAQLTSLRSLSVRNNDIGSKGMQALAKGLTQLTSLDAGDNVKVSKRCMKQLGPLLANGEAAAAREESDGRFW